MGDPLKVYKGLNNFRLFIEGLSRTLKGIYRGTIRVPSKAIRGSMRDLLERAGLFQTLVCLFFVVDLTPYEAYSGKPQTLNREVSDVVRFR